MGEEDNEIVFHGPISSILHGALGGCCGPLKVLGGN